MVYFVTRGRLSEKRQRGFHFAASHLFVANHKKMKTVLNIMAETKANSLEYLIGLNYRIQGHLIYTSLNRKSAYRVILHSSKDFDTCKKGG